MEFRFPDGQAEGAFGKMLPVVPYYNIKAPVPTHSPDGAIFDAATAKLLLLLVLLFLLRSVAPF